MATAHIDRYLLKRRRAQALACAYARETNIFFAIDKNGVLSFISQKKYPSCIVKKNFNENAK